MHGTKISYAPLGSMFFIIDGTSSSVLDTMTVSHFALDSSYSLRFIDLFYIIPGLKFLKKQNSLLVILQASTLSSTAKGSSGNVSIWRPLDMNSTNKTKPSRAEQMAHHLHVVFTLRCQQHQFGGANVQPPQHICPKGPWPEMSFPTWNSGNQSHGSASTPRLSTGLKTREFSDSTELSGVFAQVGVSRVHYIWLSRSLAHCRQSDIFVRWFPLLRAH